MSLRSRLIAAFVAVFVLLGVSSVVVTLVQRSYLMGQVDQQLTNLTPAAGAVISRLANNATRPNAQSALQSEFSEFYIGRVAPDGRMQTFVAPVSDPELVPELPTVPVYGTPLTVRTSGGSVNRVRIIETRLNDGSISIFGVSMSATEAAIRRLIITEGIASLIVLSVMGLVVFWVVRLGIRPIRRMTEAADAISAGSIDTRVDVPSDGTEAARLGHALNTMIDTTRATETRLRQFVSDASHELRTPLTTLRGYTALYEAGGFERKEDLDDAMRRMGNEAARMGRIVDDLLLLAKLDEHGAPAPEPVELGGVLRDLASDITVVQPGRPVSVECPEPVIALIDRDHLTQTITAFTTNALRYTDATAEIILRASVSKGRARVEVSDRGPGIVEADLPRLFDRFYRADSGRSRAAGGNGLGLAIVASIISSNHGTYGVNSVVGFGSTFWFELPTAPNS
ncbi:MAG: HAMP domain-containing protein [Actinobacteria bacterium]|uniref:histidine kinase n=1 Tax=freshwater metagenome TaxID=449393 RepID=A0A6J6YAP6_9ZZZZ|nr:HAMP domain-containing protein [Actinomycetota bacterium]